MSTRQRRTRELDGQDKSRRSVSCPLDREPFCGRNRAPPGRPGRWKGKFLRDLASALLQPTCQRARRSPRNLSAEAGAEYFPLSRSRMRQFESGSVAGPVCLLRPAIFGSTIARSLCPPDPNGKYFSLRLRGRNPSQSHLCPRSLSALLLPPKSFASSGTLSSHRACVGVV